MSLQIEKLEHNMAKLTIEASVEEFEDAMQKAFLKNRNKINVQGFRKGKAPRVMIERIYGPGIFYEDAANEIIPKAYEKAADESGLEIVSRPEIDVVQVEKGKSFIFTAEVALKPEVKLGQYKDIEIQKREAEVTEDEIDAKINKEREQNSRMLTVDDRPLKMGDIAVIDFEGFAEGKAFEGGKGEGYSLTLGSHSFIDNFEEQLVGMAIGDEAEICVTFPEDYQASDLAGKPAVFKVKINEIKVKELPELDDDFAQDVSEYDTLKEYKESIQAAIRESKEKDIKTAKENEIVDKIIENSEMDIPDPMINEQVRQMAEDFAQRMKYQGLTIEQYFQYTGMDSKKFLDSLRPQAVKRIQSRLILEAIVKAENISATEEETEKELEEMAGKYQMELDKLKEMIGEHETEHIKEDIAVEKAINLVVSLAKEMQL